MILAVGDSFFDQTAACYSNIKLKPWPEHIDDEVKIIGMSGCDNWTIFRTVIEEYDKHAYDKVIVNWTQLHRITIGRDNFIDGGAKRRDWKKQRAFIEDLHEKTEWFQIKQMIERFEALEKAINHLPCKVIQTMGPYPFGPKNRISGSPKAYERYWDLIENCQHVMLAELDCKWTDVFTAENDGHPNNEGHRLIYNWMKDKL